VQEYVEFIKASLQQDFVQESILVVMSVVFGGLITVIINNGAMKKQSKFEMQRKIIEGLLQRAENLQKGLEQLEIGKVIRVNTNAMAANQPRRKFEEIPLGSGGFQNRFSVNTHPIKDNS
jgi:hypothetical protein